MRLSTGGPLVRAGVRLAYGRGVGQRRRLAAVALCALLASFGALIGVGLIKQTVRQHERDRARGFRVVTGTAAKSTPLRIDEATPVWHGRQFEMWWVEVRRSDAPIAPGLPAWPKEGTYAVSPGLARAIRSSPVLMAGFPRFTVIGDAGIRNGQELVAWGRLPPGAPASSFAVSGFGAARGSLIEADPGLRAVIVGVVLLVFLPCAVTLACATGAANPVRERRLAVLSWIGVGRRQLAVLVGVENLCAALPGILTAAVLWALVGSRIEHLPPTALRPVAGDLVLAPAMTAAILAGIGVGTMALGMAHAARLTRDARSITRPRAGRRLSKLRLAPLVAGFALSTLILIDPGGPNAPVLSIASIACYVAGISLAVPLVGPAIGRALAKGPSTVELLAGRSLEADPVGATRSMMGVAVLVFVFMSATGYLRVTRAEDRFPASDSRIEAVQVTWAVSAPGDVERFRGALPPGTTLATVNEVTGAIGMGCDGLGNFGIPRGQVCDPSGRLTAEGARRLGALLGLPAYGPPAHLDASAAPPPAFGAHLVVLAERGSGLEDRVLAAAAGTLIDFDSRPVLERLAWRSTDTYIEAFLTGAVIALSVGALVTYIDRCIRQTSALRNFVLLGLDRRRLRNLEVLQFFTVFGLMVGSALILGTVSLWLMARVAAHSFPGGLVLGVTAVTLLAAVVGGAVVAASFRDPTSLGKSLGPSRQM